ncbi:hypothetical protein C2G38_2265800 [Gigaspora rosea]|uniref:Uncharacterized protein n=1 Tax=Gigaspora rosea TaxID=44941 RepID=A0A397US82_9GLOM|nr:hypothetical protein C2G38_2265800 [Gigaspora rosea]
MAKTLSLQFRKPQLEPIQKPSPMALGFGTIGQQNVSASLRGFLQNWQNWQQNQHNQDNLKIPQKQNNPFSFEIFETQKEIVPLQCPCKDCIERRKFADNSAKRNTKIKEEKDEVYEHIKKYYPIKMKILNGKFKGMLANFQEFFNHKRKENPQIDDFLNQQEELQSTSTKEEEEICSHYTFSSEDIEEINKPWGSQFINLNEKMKLYPMLYIMTRKEQDLLCKYEVFESKKITFSNKKEYDIFRDLTETLSLNKDITSKFAKFEKARKWRKQQDQKRKELTNSRSNTEYSESKSEKELIIIDSDREEITMDKPEKRVITKLSKLPLSKLLDLKEISELPPDQYKITKNTLFYLKQQETKKIQKFLGQDPKITKGNYPNIANSFYDHFNMYFDHIRSHAKLVAGEGAIAIGKTTFFGNSKNT